MANPKTVIVVYEGPEAHVHIDDRAFDVGRPVEIDKVEAERFAAKVKELRVVKPDKEKG